LRPAERPERCRGSAARLVSGVGCILNTGNERDTSFLGANNTPQ